MDLVLLAVLRPLLFLLLWGVVVYWIAAGLYKIIPDGRIKSFLFRRRGR